GPAAGERGGRGGLGVGGDIEERPGFPGALRRLGGWGGPCRAPPRSTVGHFGAPHLYCCLTIKWARRFFAQHASLCSEHCGFSSPYEMIEMRPACTPCAER